MFFVRGWPWTTFILPVPSSTYTTHIAGIKSLCSTVLGKFFVLKAELHQQNYLRFLEVFLFSDGNYIKGSGYVGAFCKFDIFCNS
jgi:hypothetical protein